MPIFILYYHMNTNQTLEFDLSNQRDIILYLIHKELLDINLQNRFHQVGIDLTLFSTDLGDLILFMLGFTNKSDSLWEFYYETMNHFAIELDSNATHRVILNCYFTLKRFELI